MSSLYTKWVANVFFPLHERLKKHTTVSVLKDMEKTQWYTRKQLEQMQLDKLRAFLKQVSQSVPYYSSLMQQTGFEPDSVSSLDDLARLPFLTKAIIRANLDDLKATGVTDLSRFNTGGSSGEPLIFFIGKERVSHDVAAKWRATRWWDVDIGDKEIVVWGSPIELGAQDRVKQVRDKVLRTRLIPAFEMSEANLDRFIAEIVEFKPEMLFGYPSSLALIANRAEQQNARLDNLGIKVAFVTSERLYDHQREAIERVFGCRVANGYGGRDAGFIAHECPQGNLHVTAEDIILEIADQNGNVLPGGEAGEIVITHLATKDFPFIRYRTGDVGRLSEEQCKCGRGLPVLAEIQGRSSDFVVASDGTVMHGLALIYVLREISGIKSFKVVQENLKQTNIYIVTEEGFDPSNTGRIINGFKNRLGDDVTINIEYVNEIEREKSGKFRYIVSKVDVSQL